MSTFLVTLTVVVLALAGAVAVAVRDPEQPATLRARKPRVPAAPRHPAKRTAQQRKAAREAPRPGRPVAVPASVEISGFSDHWVPASGAPTVWLRLRSGVVLTFLLTVVGALIAVGVAGFIVLVALALRSAVS